MGRHVVISQKSALLFHVGGDLPGDVSAIKLVATALGNSLQRLGKPRVTEDLAFGRRATIGHERVGESIEIFQYWNASIPVVRNHLREAKTVLCVVDRRRENLLHRHRTKTLVQFEPAVDRAGHTDRQRSV